MIELSCRVCSSGPLRMSDEYAALPRVTSDCKPWPAGGKISVCSECGAIQKLPDAAWRDEIDRIYGSYQIYDLSSGSEQIIFNGPGASAPRSHLLVDFILANLKLPKRGKLIDVGCGNGAALGTFSKALTDWTLYGSELSDAALPLLQRLPNFASLYTVEPAQIRERFDVVTMIHSLEHMPSPEETLVDVLKLLTPGGHLFVEVPDTETTPFDIIVADHLMHFTKTTLGLLAERVGLSAKVLRNDVLPKELTLIAGPGGSQASRRNPSEGVDLLQRNISWLRDLITAAKSSAQKNSQFGVFGTSISGIWLYGALQDRVKFFVDEDRSRVGRSFAGRPIIAPEDVPSGGVVYMPLIPAVADRVASRLRHLDAKFEIPPTLAI